MPVDIEYPIPGDLVGHTFRAGGDYTATAKGVLPAGSKVVSKVYDEGGTLRDTKEDPTIAGQQETGNWEVEHVLTPSTTSYPNCRIEAQLFVGTTADGPADVVEDINVTAPALGTISISL